MFPTRSIHGVQRWRPVPRALRPVRKERKAICTAQWDFTRRRVLPGVAVRPSGRPTARTKLGRSVRTWRRRGIPRLTVGSLVCFSRQANNRVNAEESTRWAWRGRLEEHTAARLGASSSAVFNERWIRPILSWWKHFRRPEKKRNHKQASLGSNSHSMKRDLPTRIYALLLAYFSAGSRITRSKVPTTNHGKGTVIVLVRLI